MDKLNKIKNHPNYANLDDDQIEFLLKHFDIDELLEMDAEEAFETAGSDMESEEEEE